MFYTSLTVVNSIQYVLNGKSQKVDYSSYESFTREMDSFTSIAKQLVGIAPFVVQIESYSMCNPSHSYYPHFCYILYGTYKCHLLTNKK